MNPTISLKNQLSQLFSPDDSLPNFNQVKCISQKGNKDCGVFAIAYAVDILNGNLPHQYTYDQTKMRDHLITCYEQNRLTPFPKYTTSEEKPTYQKNEVESTWKIPRRRSKRIQEKHNKSSSQSIELTNRFISSIKTKNPKVIENHSSNNTLKKSKQITPVIHNISGITLSDPELTILEKGLNFCPSTDKLKKDELLDDIFNFCRNMRLKEHFSNDNENIIQPNNPNINERCPMKTKHRNPYYNPPMNTSPNLEKYIACIKSEISELVNQPNKHPSNLTPLERNTLKSIANRNDITIKRADKGGKVVVMETSSYITECKKQLDNEHFYTKLDNDPTMEISATIHEELSRMHSKEMIDKKEYGLLKEHLDTPRIPIFYGLPKIHKAFTNFPPLRPIVSAYNSNTARLSEYVDSFLKYQASRCSSYIRDTKHFLNIIKNIKIPKNSTLVTMDVKALYTNIDHEEGADACFRTLERRKDKTIPSVLLKNLITLILKSNVFRFGTTLYKQIMGTAMGTPMAPNYANLFMHELESRMLDEYFTKTGLKPMLWLRFIDDIFFVWEYDQKSLEDFIEFCDNFTQQNEMKSEIKFEVNISNTSVNFLDVNISIKDGHFITRVHSKPTDAHLYLNAQSCHPKHVINNIPKGQLIRIRRICSKESDFLDQSKIIIQHFVNRGFHQKLLTKSLQEVKNMKREDLLAEKKVPPKDAQSVFICTWHPKLRKLPSILKENFPIIENDDRLSKIFTTTPSVGFRRMKNIANFVVRNDITPKEKEPKRQESKCKCVTCKILNTNATEIHNTKSNRTIKTAKANCKSKGVIYIAECTKHKLLYVGHSGDTLAERMYRHRYDIKKRPENNELAEHFHKNHDIGKDLKLYVAHTDINHTPHRVWMEDRVMCQLQSKRPTGLNSDHGAYAKEMYSLWRTI